MFFQATLLVAALVSVAHTFRLPQQKQPDIHLAHECVKLHSAHHQKYPPVIMLHGLTDRKETWDGIYQHIPFFTGRRVCIYDARNHGDSAWNDTFSLESLAEDLEFFMSSMEMERAALVGHSLGGLTAMKFALKNPGKVEKLLVEDISPVKIPDEAAEDIANHLKLFLGSLTVIPENADEATAKRAVTEFVRKFSKELSPEQLFRQHTLRLRDGVWQWETNFSAFVKAFDDVDVFLGNMEGEYDRQTLFIYGTASPFKVGDQKEAITKLFPKAKFVGVEGAGHGIHSKHPEFLRELIKFLK